MRASWARVIGVVLALSPAEARSERELPAAPVAWVSDLGDAPGAVAVSSDGTTVACADSAHAIRLIDLATAKPKRVLKGLKHSVDFLAFAGGDADVLVSMGTGGGPHQGKSVIRFWSWSNGGVRQDLDTSDRPGGAERACEVAVSPATRDVAVSFSSLKLRVLDPHRTRPPRELQADESYIASCLAFAADGLRLVSVDGFRAEEGRTALRIHRRATENDPWGHAVAFTDKTFLPKDYRDSQSFTWSRVVFGPGAKRVVAHGWLGPDDENPSARQYDILRCWDAETGSATWTEEVDPRRPIVCGLITSPRGELIVARYDGIEFRDPGTGKVLRTLGGATGSLRHAALSPDGRYVFATSFAGVLWRWDLGEAAK